jgi:hypothetical protein
MFVYMAFMLDGGFDCKKSQSLNTALSLFRTSFVCYFTKRLFMKNSNRFSFFSALCALALSFAMVPASLAQTDSLHNPKAGSSKVERSPMVVPIQGWTHDLKYPVYPIAVVGGGATAYYTTKGPNLPYKEFTLAQLTCEIGQAPVEVLKNKNYTCVDGVCYGNDVVAIIGTDPRKPASKTPC